MSGTTSSMRDAPLVRLNSGRKSLLNDEAPSSQPSGPSRQTSSRTLVPQRPPTAPSVRNNPGLTNLYSAGHQESATSLLPPSSQSRTHRFRDEESLPGSPVYPQSRRTSWSSDGHSRDSRVYAMNPFKDSRAPSRAGSDDDNVNTQTVSEKYNITPGAGLLLFPEDVEKDDWLHNPDPNEEKKRECDIFTRRGLVNVGGLTFLTLGILVLFIGYPILCATENNYHQHLKLTQDRTFVQKYTDPPDPCKANPDCIGNGKMPLFKNTRTTMIDPDTPRSARTKKAKDGSTLQLTVSSVPDSKHNINVM